jgi:hypothetical protein
MDYLYTVLELVSSICRSMEARNIESAPRNSSSSVLSVSRMPEYARRGSLDGLWSHTNVRTGRRLLEIQEVMWILGSGEARE